MNFLKKIAISAVAMLGFGYSTASAVLTPPDFSGTIADMGIAFTAILTLVVAGLGYKFVRRMFT